MAVAIDTTRLPPRTEAELPDIARAFVAAYAQAGTLDAACAVIERAGGGKQGAVWFCAGRVDFVTSAAGARTIADSFGDDLAWMATIFRDMADQAEALADAR